MNTPRDTPEDTGRDTPRDTAKWYAIAVVVLLVIVALSVRQVAPSYWPGPEGTYFRDADTVRRLARLQHLEQATTYPSANPKEGFPAGTVSHWTRPMDWVIQGLEPFVPRLHPNAREYESGAAWSGRLLGSLSVLAFALLAWRWQGARAGLLAAALYTLSAPLVLGSQLGNGDHKNLQHLALVVAILGLLCVLRGRGSGGLAVLSGAAMGLALWVSTESMVVLVLISVAMGCRAVYATVDERRASRKPLLLWSLGCIALCVLGDRIENPSVFWTFEWDRISGFQILMATALPWFVLVLGFLDTRMPGPRATPWLAGATLLIPAAFVFVGPLGDALDTQRQLYDDANKWVQNYVREYDSLLWRPIIDRFTTGLATYSFTYTFFLLPLLLAGLLRHKGLSRQTRATLGVMAIGTLILCLYNLKLIHIFSILYPFVILLGIDGCFAFFRKPAPGDGMSPAVTTVAVLVIVVFFSSLMGQIRALGPLPASSQVEMARLAERRLMAAVAGLGPGDADDERQAVLAPWNLGARLMYDANKPVVASGYHRNLAGILDAYRFYASEDLDEAAEILARRGVRWVVWHSDPSFFLQLPELLPELGSYVEMVGTTMSYRPRLALTMWKRLEGSQELQGRFRPVYRSQLVIDRPHGYSGPDYKVYEVMDR